MVMYLRFAINSHVHNQRHRITPLEPPQNFSLIVFFSKGFWPLSDMLADQYTTFVIALDWSNPCLK